MAPKLPRKPDGSIDYRKLGAWLELDASSGELGRFSRDMWQSTDGAMRSLATFASFLCTAKCERRAGRIDAAMLAEANADTVYQRDILPENRW